MEKDKKKAESDHYRVLDLPSGIEGTKLTEKEIKKAYRRKALQLHPDKRPNDPNANAKFQRLQSSYATLMDPLARKLFDASLIRLDNKPSPSKPKTQTSSSSKPKTQTSSSSQPKTQTSSSSKPKTRTSFSSSQPKAQTSSSTSSQPKKQTSSSQPKKQTSSSNEPKKGFNGKEPEPEPLELLYFFLCCVALLMVRSSARATICTGQGFCCFSIPVVGLLTLHYLKAHFLKPDRANQESESQRDDYEDLEEWVMV